MLQGPEAGIAAGSIKRRRYKRADGSTREVWRAQHPNPMRGGAHKIERAFPTKREAERWMTEQRAAVQRGEWINPADGERTFAQVAGEWRQTWADLEPKTRAGYESILHALEQRFGRAPIAALRTDALQRFINELAEQRATNTVRRYFTVLNAVMRVAVERRYLASNPCASVRMPKRQGPRREQLFLTPEEVAAVAEAVPEHWRVLVYTAAYTGLRAGELCGLRRKRLDTLRGTLRVEEALKEVSGRLIFGEPKTGASRRTVSLPKSIRDMLAEHLAVAVPWGQRPGRSGLHDADRQADPAQPVLQADLQARRRAGAARDEARAPLPRPPAHLREPQPRRRAEPPHGQGAPRPRGHPDDDQHLRPPRAERRCGTLRRPGRSLSISGARQRRAVREGVRTAVAVTAG